MFNCLQDYQGPGNSELRMTTGRQASDFNCSLLVCRLFTARMPVPRRPPLAHIVLRPRPRVLYSGSSLTYILTNLLGRSPWCHFGISVYPPILRRLFFMVSRVGQHSDLLFSSSTFICSSMSAQHSCHIDFCGISFRLPAEVLLKIEDQLIQLEAYAYAASLRSRQNGGIHGQL